MILLSVVSTSRQRTTIFVRSCADILSRHTSVTDVLHARAAVVNLKLFSPSSLMPPLPNSPTIVPFPQNSLAVFTFFSQTAEHIVLKNPWDSYLGFNFFRDLTFHGGKQENNEQQEVPSTQKGIPPNSVAFILISWPVGIVKWKVLSPFWEMSQVEPVFANWEDLTEPTKSG